MIHLYKESSGRILMKKIQAHRLNPTETGTVDKAAERLTNVIYNGAKETLGFKKNQKGRHWYDEEFKC